MKRTCNGLFALIFLCVWAATPSSSLAATVPAGTTLSVKTVGAISSHTRAGGVFTATLDRAVGTNGKILLPAGTQIAGIVEASRGNPTRSAPLTLNLTSVSVDGKTIPIKTTGEFQPQAQAKTTRQSRGGFSVGKSTFPAGTKLEFRLAQPLQL
jgi:hypothetical protein